MSDAQQLIQTILGSLSIQETASLLAGKDIWHTVSIPGKGVKALRLSDGPNGVRGVKTFNGSQTTAFPCPTAQGATWNKDLMYQIGAEMAAQAKAKGVSVILAPTVNLHRSPLGGRGFECFSEDPVLSGYLGAPLIRGIQDNGIGACVKHFVCNDQETDRMKVNVIVDERTLREVYLKPFQIIIRDAQPWAVMASYNRVNGVHASENKVLLDDILRKEWGWNGLVLSDWFGVSSCEESLNAGLDLEMPGPSLWRTPDQLLRTVGAGKVSLPTLIARAANVITLMLKVSGAGLEENAEEKEDNSQKSRDINSKAAQEAIVLLKNSQGLLPLKNPSSIAVIGPNATRNLSTGGGSASLHQYYYVSAYEGLQRACSKLSPEAELSFSQGCFAHEMLPLLETHTTAGEKGLDLEFFSGDFETPGDVILKTSTAHAQMIFFDSLPKVVTFPAQSRITGTFIPDLRGTHEFSLITTGRARLYVDGKLVVSSWENQERSAKFFGLAAKEIKGRIELKESTSYKILVEYSSISSFKENHATPLGAGILRIGAIRVQDPDQVMEEAVRTAAEAEVAILCVGTDQERESEGYDRADMKLVGRQNELVEKVLAVNPSTVILNFSGVPVEMPWASKASTIVQAWFLGSELGNAVAGVVFGEYNPSGRLPVSFPLKLEDNPSHGNFPGENATVKYTEGLNIGYRHFTTQDIPVAFPFGHGLSYTKFKYSNLRSDSWALGSDGNLNVSVDIENIGHITGSEVVQLYIAPINTMVYRPKRELQGFEKVIDLAPSSRKTVFFALDKHALSYYDEKENAWILAKGKYKVEIGMSSETIVLEHELTVQETPRM